MKVLTIDIERRPALGYVWSLWKQNVQTQALVEHGEMISFAAKWLGEKPVIFYSTYHHGKEEMVAAAHALLDEADVVVTYNGDRFDIPHLQTEFILQGLNPPSPFESVDLFKSVKKQFNFISNKLDYVCGQLGLPQKTSHDGFKLWLDCIAGKDAAWTKMRRYNKNDVVITEQLYMKLLPWNPKTPNRNLYEGEGGVVVCPACGGEDLQRRGYQYTALSVFQRLHCQSCGKWSKITARVDGTQVRGL